MEEDLLGAFQVARAIHRTITRTPPAWSTRIGLYGRWGTGKTGVLKLLKTLETSKGAVVISFSAWSASGEAGIIKQLYEALASNLDAEHAGGASKGKAVRIATVLRRHIETANKFGKVAEALAPVVPKGTSDVIAGIAHSALSALEIKKSDLDELLELFSGRRIVVFIDDLDRADPTTIPKTLLALREMLDWKGFSFVVAFDPVVVGQALAEYSKVYGDQSQTFLEKVIDVPFEIPKPTAAQKLALARKAFGACCPFVPTSVIEAYAMHLPDEPRRVKQIARRLGVLRTVAKRHAPDELDWTALLLHAVLQEASADGAAKVVDLGVSTGAWEGRSDSGAQKMERRTKQEEILKPLFAGTRDDVERPVKAAQALIDHWKYLDEGRIRYHVRLSFEEPAFTLHELDSFAKLAAAVEVLDIAKEIGQGAERSGLPREMVAAELMASAVERYGIALREMSNTSVTLEREAAQTGAQTILRFLQRLWATDDDPDLRAARQDLDAVVAPLLQITIGSAYLVDDHGDAQLRQAEQDLALRAIDGCPNPEGVFHATNPYWASRRDRDAPAVTAWKERIRGRVEGQIVRRLLERFRQPEGLEPIARGSDGWQILTWFMECGESPLYVSASLRALLLAELSRASDGDRQSKISAHGNAIWFLKMLCGAARSDMFAGDQLPASVLANVQPDIVSHAWSLATSLSVPLNTVLSIHRLRSQLMKAGVPDALLPIPAWLADASKRRDDAEAGSKPK